jgi:O-antigen/teichoic acid export membrane protein
MNNLLYFVTGAILGTSDVGLLRAATALLGVMNVLFLGMENIVPIAAARRFGAQGMRALSRYLAAVSVLGGMVTILVSATLALASKPILSALFGPNFSSAAWLTLPLAVNNLFYFLAMPAMIWLRTTEDTRAVFNAYAVSSLASIIVAYPLVFFGGVFGAACGVLIGNVFNLGLLIVQIQALARDQG